MDAENCKAYTDEMERWIAERILVPWAQEVNVLLLLLAVEQVKKSKVWPVMDFQDLNEYMSSYKGNNIMDICRDWLREWRQIEGEGKIVDLKAAYLRLRVEKGLWKHQLVKLVTKYMRSHGLDLDWVQHPESWLSYWDQC